MKAVTMKQGQGFSLIELVIVMAIVSIIAAIAYPSYLDHVIDSRRSEAMAELQQAATAMERYFTINGSYAGATAGNSGGATITNRIPATGTRYYSVTLGSLSATGFTITATPVSGTSQAGDGRISIDHTGLKRWDEGGDGTFNSPRDDNWIKG